MIDLELENGSVNVRKYLQKRYEKKREDKCPCTVENDDEIIEKSQLEYRATHEAN